MIKVIYLDEEKGIVEMEVKSLNYFYGANIPNLQVLKSAAGYYIGTLYKDNYDDMIVWGPYSRDSDCYWSERYDAEMALRTSSYPVKF